MPTLVPSLVRLMEASWAGAAGGGHQNQFDVTVQIGQLREDAVHVKPARAGDDLGDVHHGSAADGDDTTALGQISVTDHGIDHLVGGLGGAVLVGEQQLSAVDVTVEERVVDDFDGEDQIALAHVEFVEKRADRVEPVQHGTYFNQFHYVVPFRRSCGRWRVWRLPRCRVRSCGTARRGSPASRPGRTGR